MALRPAIRTLLLVLSLFLSACITPISQSEQSRWEYADLRALDRADINQPSLDLIAIYTRDKLDDLQIRLDMLEHAQLADYDLFILLNTRPGGTHEMPLSGAQSDKNADLEWDISLVVPASGSLKAIDSSMEYITGLSMHILRDPIQENVVISLNRESIFPDVYKHFGTHPIGIQAFLTSAGGSEIVDSIGPIRTDARPPPPVSILFSFWNVMPAYTPALALRRWDGAHTGPYGGRHGLYNLLRTARRASIPLVLLDLKSPISLVALSHLDRLSMINQIQSERLLILPEYLPDLPQAPPYINDALANRYLDENLSITEAFDLPASHFLSTNSRFLPSQTNAKLAFIRLPGLLKGNPNDYLTSVSRRGNLRVLPINNQNLDWEQATLDGPSLEMKHKLIESAIRNLEVDNQWPTKTLILGGNLPTSTWGSPQAARATFRYINEHPWIHTLNVHDLIVSPVTPLELPLVEQTDYSNDFNELFNALLSTPKNPIGRAASDALQTLYGPLYPQPDELVLLRKHYHSMVWSLINAAHWAENPEPIASCHLDPDHDGTSECILASEQIYAQFERESGVLMYAFAHQAGQDDQIHQFIAPSSQFNIGLSDPSSWDLTSREQADPSVTAGAFNENGIQYVPTVIPPNELSFASEDSTNMLNYTLTAQGIRLDYQFADQITPREIALSLTLDPWNRFRSDWSKSYYSQETSSGWEFGLHDGPIIRVTEQNYEGEPPIEAITFLDSSYLLEFPENPNRDYPPGHKLPYPMVKLKLNASGNIQITIELISNP